MDREAMAAMLTTQPGRPQKPARSGFGRTLAQAQKAKGLRDVDVALICNVQPNTVARWRRGERVPCVLEQEGILARLKRARKQRR
jgi:hypothetical protein